MSNGNLWKAFLIGSAASALFVMWSRQSEPRINYTLVSHADADVVVGEPERALEGDAEILAELEKSADETNIGNMLIDGKGMSEETAEKVFDYLIRNRKRGLKGGNQNADMMIFYLFRHQPMSQKMIDIMINWPTKRDNDVDLKQAFYTNIKLDRANLEKAIKRDWNFFRKGERGGASILGLKTGDPLVAIFQHQDIQKEDLEKFMAMEDRLLSPERAGILRSYNVRSLVKEDTEFIDKMLDRNKIFNLQYTWNPKKQKVPKLDHIGIGVKSLHELMSDKQKHRAISLATDSEKTEPFYKGLLGVYLNILNDMLGNKKEYRSEILNMIYSRFPMYWDQKKEYFRYEDIYAGLEFNWLQDVLETIYHAQRLTDEEIHRAIDFGIGLAPLIEKQRLSEEHVKRLIEKMDRMDQKSLDALVSKIKNNGMNVDMMEFINRIGECKLGFRLFIGRNHNDLDLDMQKAIVKGAEKDDDVKYLLEYTYRPSDELLDYCLEVGKGLEYVYGRRQLDDEKLNEAIEKGKHIDKIIQTQGGLNENHYRMLFEKGVGLRALYERQKLPGDLVTDAIEKGEYLEELYRRYPLDKKQIQIAVDIGRNIEELVNRNNLDKNQMEELVERGLGLEVIYEKTNDRDLKRKIEEKAGGTELPEHEVLRRSVKRAYQGSRLLWFPARFQEALEKRKENEYDPIAPLCGTYTLGGDVFIWPQIKELFEGKGYTFKDGDYHNVYRTDDQGRESSPGISKLLTKWAKDDPNMVLYIQYLKKMYQMMKDRGLKKPPEPKKGQKVLEIIVTQDPGDIATCSSGRSWAGSSCLSLEGMCGWWPKPSWYDDIAANNGIAILKHKGNDKWLGRMLLRWCIRKDDGKTDVVIENMYASDEGDRNEHEMRQFLVKLCEEHGYTGGATRRYGGGDDVICESPYEYRGSADYSCAGSQAPGPISYKVKKR